MSKDKKGRFQLHEERLSTTDEDGKRIFLHPEEVKGFWRNKRNFFYWVLILFYLILPWIHYQGKQIILLDIAKREFTILGTTFLGHDAPLLLLLFLGSIFLLGFITSIWGRIWCGWACPQTVFIDSIYRKIDLLIEGNSRKRFKLDESSWNLEKLVKRNLKWLLYLIVSLHIAHSSLGYFVGTRELFWMSLHSPSENMTAFLTMIFLTLLFFIDFGFFREQFCLIACPYGRFQSVFMDDDSFIIAYDKTRGEPRRNQDIQSKDEGDCIDCMACVKVCPTGIDIRRGTQLECIACTQCIDACDDIMTKVGKPKGLVRYDTEVGLRGEKTNFLKLRSLFYLVVLLGIFAAFFVSLSKNRELRVVFLRSSRTPYLVIKKDLNIQNQFHLTFDHKREIPYNVSFDSDDLDYKSNLIRLIIPRNPFVANKGHQKSTLFIRFSKNILIKGKKILKLKIYDQQKNKKILLETREVNLVGPF